MDDRIYGYETEYAVVLSPDETGRHYRNYSVREEEAPGKAAAPSLRRAAIYDYLEHLISSHIKVLTASYRKRGVFLENGGLFNYEAIHSNYFEGLVEMATPECLSARDVALHHAAQNSLLFGAAEEFRKNLRQVAPAYAGTVLIGKSNVDAKGTCIGTHENYLVNDKPGFISSLFLSVMVPCFWLIHLIILILSFLPVVILTPLLLGSALVMALLGGLFSGIRVTEGLGRAIRAFNGFLLSDDFLVNYFGRFQAEFSRIIFMPWIFTFSAAINPFVFTRIKKELTPFLVTRTIFCGSGKLTLPPPSRPRGEKGERHRIFALSQRAAAIRSICRIYFDDGNRPIYDLRDFFIEPLSALHPRKRLHVMLSDSNMSTVGVYLKFGITGLILNMIEQGHSFRKAHLDNPLAALRILSRDTSLRAAFPVKGGRSLTALEVQKYYHEEARAFYAKQKTVPRDVQDILDRWGYVLQALEISPNLLYRKVDWVTKRDLMEQVLRGRGTMGELEEVAEWLALIEKKNGVCEPPMDGSLMDGGILTHDEFLGLRHFLASRSLPIDDFLRRWRLYNELLKVDFKFHQLDGEGYYYQLLAADLVDELFTGEEIEKAKENPPSRTRAYIRGSLVKKYGYRSEPGGIDSMPENSFFSRTRIGWSKFYLKWPWKKITFTDPFDFEYASIEKTLEN